MSFTSSGMGTRLNSEKETKKKVFNVLIFNKLITFYLDLKKYVCTEKLLCMLQQYISTC
jgi:hypothetical protein